MTSLEIEGAAGDTTQLGPPSSTSLGGSAPMTDPLVPPDQAAAVMDSGSLPAGRDQTSSDPPTPTEADSPDPFDRERLFDLLFRSQSRRLNEQRCPPPRPPARPWHSLPGTPTGGLLGGAGRFCSLTSLQAEQFFDLVATAQARRLDDQRADFAGGPRAEEGAGEGPPEPEEGPRSPPTRGRSCTAPSSPTSQRLEEQRSDPPIPLGAQELFDLLLRVQGGRMEEQRSEPPRALLPHPC